MEALLTIEPDFEAENIIFERVQAKYGMSFERLPGGFYASRETQACWSAWIGRAALAANGIDLRALVTVEKEIQS